MNATRHPESARLQSYAMGRPPEAGNKEIEDHLADCPVCLEVVRSVKPDAFAAGVHRVCQVESTSETVGPGVLVVAESVSQLLAKSPEGIEAKVRAILKPHAVERPVKVELLPLKEHPRYQVLERVGTGGMGEVYKARHLVMDKDVALKMIRAKFLAHPEAVERFRREVRAAARLDHPNIVRAHDAESCDNQHFLVMEYIEGDSLLALAERGKLSVAQACEFVRQAALGLQYAHEKGMVHRDIKPHNLILSSDGIVKILDFGLARFISQSGPEVAMEVTQRKATLTAAGAIMGTVDYMAPEQAADAKNADIRADIYSLGCTLYHLLAGAPPFVDASGFEMKLVAHRTRNPMPLNRLRGDVPAALSDLVMRMLAKEPTRRPGTPADVASALEPFAQVKPPAPPVEQVIAPPKKPRHPFALAAGLLAALAVVVTAAVVIYVATDNGELRIKVDDPDVSVRVLEGGKLVSIVDAKTGHKVQLRSGEYRLLLGDDTKGLVLSTDQFTLRRGDKQIVEVKRTIAKAKEAKEEKTTPQEEKQPEVVEKPQAVAPKSSPELVQLRRFEGHTETVEALAVAPDGREAASCSGDNTVRIWNLQAATERRLVNQSIPISSIAYFPDGSRLATGDAKGSEAKPGEFSVRVWDAHSGKENRAYSGHTAAVECVAVSPDRSRLMSGSRDKTIRVWEVETGRAMHALHGHESEVKCVAFSPDGRTGLSAGRDGTIRMWDLVVGRELGRWKGHTEPVLSVAFSPDGQRALSASLDKTMRLWDAATGQQLRSFLHPTGLSHASFSPDGRRALATGKDSLVRLWDLDAGKELARFAGHTSEPVQARFLPDGKSALSCGGDKLLRLFELPYPTPLQMTQVRTYPGPNAGLHQVAFMPDGKRVISTGSDGFVRVCDRTTGKELLAVKQPGEAHALAVSPDSKFALIGVWSPLDHAIRLLDLETGKEVRRLIGHESLVRVVVFSADGKLALSSSNDTTLRLWDVATGRQLRLFSGHTDGLLCAALSRDATLALSASWDGTVRLWEVATGRELRRYAGHVGRVEKVLFTADQCHALSVGTDRSVRLWDLATNREVRRFTGHASGILGLALSPDGRHFLTGSGGDEHRVAAGYDNVVRLYELASGRELARFEENTNMVTSVAFSPDGRQALSGSSDATVRLLQLPAVPKGLDLPAPPRAPEELVEIRRLEGHLSVLFCVAVSPDGKHVVSVGEDGGLRVWHLPTGKQVRHLERDKIFHSVAVSPDGKTALASTDHQWKDGAWHNVGNSVQLFDLETGECRHRMLGHTNRIWAVAFSPDGTRAISGSWDGVVILWNLETGKQQKMLRGHTGAVLRVAFLPDSKRAISGSLDDTLRLWDLETGTEVRRFEEKGGGVARIAVFPDGRRVLSANYDRAARLWDVETGRLLARYSHPTSLHALAITPDGKRFLTGSGTSNHHYHIGSAGHDYCVRLWDVETGEVRGRFDGHQDALRDVAVTPDGKTVVTASRDHTVRVLWLPQNETRPDATGSGQLAFAEQSLRASVVMRREGELVAALHPRSQRFIDLPPGDYELSFAPSVDGLKLSAEKVSLKKGASKTIAIDWLPPATPPSLREIRRFEGHTACVKRVVFSPDGKQAASGSWDRTVCIWDIESGKVVRKLEHLADVWGLAWSPDGKYIASGTGGIVKDGQYRIDATAIYLWDATTGKEVRKLAGHAGTIVTSVAFSPDSSRLLSGGNDMLVRLWNVETGTELRAFHGHRNYVQEVVFSSDGKQALSGGMDGMVRQWDVNTGEELKRMEGHTHWVLDVAFSPDGTRAASNGADRTVRLWDLKTGKQVGVVATLPTNPSGLKFTSAGRVLIGGGLRQAWSGAAGFDNHVRLLNVESGRELARYSGHTSALMDVAVSPDRRRALSAGHDGVIRLLELPE